MKKKLLSVLLAIVLIFTTVYIGIPTVLASNGNLITNGDFSSYSGNNPTGWRFDLPTTNSFSYEIVEDVEIPDGPITNAIKFTSSETVETISGNMYQPLDSSGKDARMYFSSTNTVKIEKSTIYTMTFWVKVKRLYGFSALMFEPDYVIPSLRRNINYAVEGHNLYTYKTTSASLRNSRDDINHIWKVVSSGQTLSNYPSSMFITRNNTYGDPMRNYQQVLTPDFPNDQREGEWLQVSQTFKTEDLDAHEADVAYTFRFPQVEGGEVWIADVRLTAEKEPVAVTVTNATGGSIKTNLPKENIPKGFNVELVATPLEGNTFTGWYNTQTGELVSNSAVYNFTANTPISLIAKFEGSNMPPTDILPLQGMDGTFEEGTVTGWFADDPEWGGSESSWCRWEKSTESAYEGNTSFMVNSRYRYINLPLKGLTQNTNYRLTMYVNPTGAKEYDDDTSRYTRIEEYGIIGPGERYLEGASDILIRRGDLKGNVGWQRLDVYFNSGERSEVVFSAKLVGEYGAVCYYDNIALYQYKSNIRLTNAYFEQGTNGWCGKVEVVTENGSNAVLVNNQKSIYQCFDMSLSGVYEIKFSAKGNGTVAVQDITETGLDIKSSISAKSYKNVQGEEWTDYSFIVNTGAHKSVNLVIAGGDGGIMVDNFSLRYKGDITIEIIEYPGNVNGDEIGQVNLDDVVALAQIVAGWQNVEHSEPHLDINGDSAVTIDDVVLLAQKVAGWNVELSDIAYKPTN